MGICRHGLTYRGPAHEQRGLQGHGPAVGPGWDRLAILALLEAVGAASGEDTCAKVSVVLWEGRARGRRTGGACGGVVADAGYALLAHFESAGCAGDLADGDWVGGGLGFC